MDSQLLYSEDGTRPSYMCQKVFLGFVRYSVVGQQFADKCH